MLSVKILGDNYRQNCERLEQETRAALDKIGLIYTIAKVTDYHDIIAYGVTNTPALVINNRVISSGLIPLRGQIVTWGHET